MSDDFMNWIIPNAGQSEKSFPEHRGRPGEVGGSLPRKQGVEAAYSMVSRSGGFTYRPGHGCPSSGYVVALQGHEQIIDKKKFTKAELRKYLYKNAGLLKSNPNLHYGAWYDSENGKIVLDLSEVVSTHEEAVKLSKKRKQAAYWGLKESQEFRVNADEGRIAAGKEKKMEPKGKPEHIIFGRDLDEKTVDDVFAEMSKIFGIESDDEGSDEEESKD